MSVSTGIAHFILEQLKGQQEELKDQKSEGSTQGLTKTSSGAELGLESTCPFGDTDGVHCEPGDTALYRVHPSLPVRG